MLMINDLAISSPHLWKFVDDTTASEFVPKGSASGRMITESTLTLIKIKS